MTLTPAALTFLRDLYTQRGLAEYRAGHPLEAAKAAALEVVEALRAGMVDGTFVELDGESVKATIKQPESNYRQEQLV
jgi:peptide subunit release factor 1 (eRF1)